MMEVITIILYPTSQEKILPIIQHNFVNESLTITPYFYRGLREAWSQRQTINQLLPDIVCICVPLITLAPRTSFLRALSLSYNLFGKTFLIDEDGTVSQCYLSKFILVDIPKLLLDLLVGMLTILFSYPFIILFRLYLLLSRTR